MLNYFNVFICDYVRIFKYLLIPIYFFFFLFYILVFIGTFWSGILYINSGNKVCIQRILRKYNPKKEKLASKQKTRERVPMKKEK